LDLGGGLCACCEGDALIIARTGSPVPAATWLAAGPAARDWPQAELPAEGLTLPAQGRVVLDANWALTLRRTDTPMPPPADARAARFDLDALALPLRLVHPQPGQRIRLLDGPGSRKLSDLFIDRKLPAAARRRLPVLLDARDEVLWVPGLARGSAAPLDAATAACLCLDLEANSR
jgi:tRNA(Ile)-lysidine synthetase-like protein